MRKSSIIVMSVGALMVPTSTLAACSDEPQNDANAYCTEVGDNLAALSSPVIGTDADVDAMVDLYEQVTKVAPIAVEPEWEILLDSLRTAATVDVTDQASVQLVADTARLSQPAATRVQTYTQQICGVVIGAPLTVPTTLAPPPTS